MLARNNQLNIIVLLLILITTSSLIWYRIYLNGQPAEDAAILLRYADHLAAGQGIVWNIGENPVDGATDFLFMVLVAALHSIGIPLKLSAQILASTAHLATISLVFLCLRYWHKTHLLITTLATLVLALGPSIGYIQAAFGTPMFAMAAAFAWYFALRVMLEPQTSQSSAFSFALFSLITGLIRPEGVLLAGFMMLSIITKLGWRAAWSSLRWMLILFGTLGLAYFLWRWWYFSYPLPNPFYKKGGGQLYWSSLQASLQNVMLLTMPWLLIYPVGLIYQTTRKLTISLLIPVLGFSIIWLLLSNEMNYLMRFQYALLPIVLLSWPLMFTGVQTLITRFSNQTRFRWFISIPIYAIIIVMMMLWFQLHQQIQIRDGRYDVALILNNYKSNDYVLATTEAGLLPLYSEWRSVDTWGLNDQRIAHAGELPIEYLQERWPAVIMHHRFPYQDAEWTHMIDTLEQYIDQEMYVLAGEFGVSADDTHVYYVRSDIPESGEIISLIEEMPYYWGNRQAQRYAP